MDRMTALRRRRRRALGLQPRRTRAGDPTILLSERLRAAIGGGDQITRAHREHPWVFRALTALTDHLTSVPLEILTGPRGSSTAVTAGPWYELFARPTPLLTRRQWWSVVWHYYHLGGAYCVLYDRLSIVRTPATVPTEMHPWSARHVGIRRDYTSGKFLGWQLHTAGGGVVDLEPWQVLDIRRVDPDEPERGFSLLDPAARAVRTDWKSARWNEGMLDNQATPAGVLSVQQDLTSEQVQRLRAEWVDLYGSPDKAGRLAVLGNGATFSPTSISPRDMAYLEQRRWSKDEVAAVFGVPLMLLGDVDAIHSKESARTILKIFWGGSIVPSLRVAEDILEGRLFAGRGDVWARFDLSDVEALQEEQQDRLLNAEKARDLGVPRNELNRRYDLGFELDDGVGNVGLVPFSLQPLAVAEGMLEDASSEPAPPSEEEDRDAAPEIVVRRSEMREAIWRSFVSQLVRPGERRMIPAVRGWLRRRRQETLAWLESSAGRSVRALSDEMIGAWLSEQRARWNEQLMTRTAQLDKQTTRGALDRLEAQLGTSLEIVSMTHPAIIQHLEAMGARKIQVVDSVQRGIRRTLLQGLAAGEALTALQERVRTTYAMAASRALTIARTETAAAANGAKWAGMIEEGIPSSSWLSAGDEEVRVFADAGYNHAIDGESHLLGTPFSNGLMYPHDPKGEPGNVINCRCEALPEV